MLLLGIKFEWAGELIHASCLVCTMQRSSDRYTLNASFAPCSAAVTGTGFMRRLHLAAQQWQVHASCVVCTMQRSSDRYSLHASFAPCSAAVTGTRFMRRLHHAAHQWPVHASCVVCTMQRTSGRFSRCTSVVIAMILTSCPGEVRELFCSTAERNSKPYQDLKGPTGLRLARQGANCRPRDHDNTATWIER